MNARQPVGTPKPCFQQERRPPSDAETIIRGVDERPPTRWNTQTMLSARTTTAKRCRNHVQGHTRTPTNPSEPPNHNFDKNDDCQAMPKSYSGAHKNTHQPRLSTQTMLSTRTTTARRCRNHIQGIIPNSPSLYGPSSALGAASRFSLLSNPPNAAERHTSWLLARKEERGSSLPLNPPHPARQGPFFETSSLPTSTRLFPGRVSKRHVDTTLGSEHGSNSLRFHDSRPLPRPRPRPRHQARSPRLRLASASD